MRHAHLTARLLILLALLIAAAATDAMAESGLPVPRFVSLASSEANLRTGPGRQYPVDWIFVRPTLPLEVIGEFDVWRQVRDQDGIEGWMHHSLLSGRRSVALQGDELLPLRADPDPAAPVVAFAEPGVIARLLACPAPSPETGDWCQVEAAGQRGWLPRAGLWGVYPGEEVR